MLTVLGGLAEFERELIRARTGEGRSRAKARGVICAIPGSLSRPFLRRDCDLSMRLLRHRDEPEPSVRAHHHFEKVRVHRVLLRSERPRMSENVR